MFTKKRIYPQRESQEGNPGLRPGILEKMQTQRVWVFYHNSKSRQLIHLLKKYRIQVQAINVATCSNASEVYSSTLGAAEQTEGIIFADCNLGLPGEVDPRLDELLSGLKQYKRCRFFFYGADDQSVSVCQQAIQRIKAEDKMSCYVFTQLFTVFAGELRKAKVACLAPSKKLGAKNKVAPFVSMPTEAEQAYTFQFTPGSTDMEEPPSQYFSRLAENVVNPLTHHPHQGGQTACFTSLDSIQSTRGKHPSEIAPPKSFSIEINACCCPAWAFWKSEGRREGGRFEEANNGSPFPFKD